MDREFSPSGPAINATTTISTLVVASNQLTGVARFINGGVAMAFVAVVNTTASSGDIANIASPLPGGAVLYIALGQDFNKVYSSGGSAAAVFCQPGYLGK